MKSQRGSQRYQKGVVLIVALIFLLMTAMISMTVMRTSTLEVKMAGNEQFREEAFQQVQAVLTAIADDSPNNLVVAGDIGYTICQAGVSGCDANTLNVVSDLNTVPTGASLNYSAVRLGPLLTNLPFRLGEEQASGAASFKAALFEVEATYDGVSAGLGRSSAAQGVAVLVASGGQ